MSRIQSSITVCAILVILVSASGVMAVPITQTDWSGGLNSSITEDWTNTFVTELDFIPANGNQLGIFNSQLGRQLRSWRLVCGV